jgi:hypothetical protein
MITRAPTPDDLRLALASANNRPERTACSQQRWMISRPDGSFALYLVNWKWGLGPPFQPFLTRIPELTIPEVITAPSFP